MRASDQTLSTAIEQAINAILDGTGKFPTRRQLYLLHRAKVGYYNDYFGVPDMPQHALIEELRHCGLDSLIPRVVNGEFDGTKEEADEWRASPEGRSTFAAFGEFLPKRAGR